MELMVYNPQLIALISLLSGLFFILCFNYWKMCHKYIHLPCFRLDLWLVKKVLAGRILKKGISLMEFNSLVFQELISTCSRWKSEGLCLMWILKPYYLFVFNKDLVKLLINHPDCVQKGSDYKILEDIVGKGLLTSNGDVWEKRRKMISKVFHISFLKDNVWIFNKNAINLVNQLEGATNEPYIEVLEFVKTCSFGNICEAALNVDIYDPKKSVELKRMMKAVSGFGDYATYRISNPLLHSKFILRLLPSGRKHLKDLDEWYNYIKQAVANIKNTSNYTESKATAISVGRPSRKCFAELLLELHVEDPSFSMDDILGEIMTFIATGYDSVSYAITWCLFMLGHHQEIQNKVFNELMSLTQDDISYDDVQSLKYMECCIMETLRLYPPSPFLGRCLQKDVQYGNYVIPKGTSIEIFAYVLHRNSDIYPDPEKFNPERFKEENWVECPWIYIPFSEGKRNCIGKQFAVAEMKIILAHVLRNFQVTSLDCKEDVELTYSIVLTSLKPLRMQLKSRTR